MSGRFEQGKSGIWKVMLGDKLGHRMASVKRFIPDSGYLEGIFDVDQRVGLTNVSMN